MEDDAGDGGLSFDFEGGLDAAPSIPTASAPANSSNSTPAISSAPDHAVTGGVGGRRSFRQTVCRHWLRGLCMKGDACGFLHQYDKARMPVCRFFRLYGECREQDCVYKHTNEDIKECNMYKLGFCPNGPDCRYRHIKLPGPPPPVEEVLQKIQQMTSYNFGNNRFFQNRNSNIPRPNEKPQFPQTQNSANQGVAAKSPMTESPSMQQQQQQQQAPGQQSQQQVGQSQIQNLPDGQQNQGNRTAIPLPQGISRYFIVKSCNRENLELSVQQGVWATQRSNEAKLNEAFDSVENVILIFSVNRTQNFQGCAKMTSRIGGYVGGGNWKSTHGTAHYGRNFSVKWLKLCELSFQKTRHLRNPFNENLPVKISRDCQELEPSIGEELASLLYLEPDSELMAISLAAESKREEEKAKGVNPENGSENQDIVPFEDNEEEEEEEDEEEESDEEEDGYGSGPMGRGRGRGAMMWPPMPHMPLPRGGPGPMRGFNPLMMGPDGFPYGPGDPFGMGGMGPRPFGPFGPRFMGDLAGPPMFPGRPPFGMVGPNRGPFMGPMRGGRPPMGANPMLGPPLPQQLPNRPMKRGPGNDKKNEKYGGGSDQGRGEGTGGLETESSKKASTPQEDQFGSGNSLRNDESESEDEAPRRSRHGEGKKKRRSLERDANGGPEQ